MTVPRPHRLFPLSALLLAGGCGHLGAAGHTRAELEFIGPYAEAMAHGCRERFAVERERASGMILTGRGILETSVRVEACDRVVSTVLDCAVPWRGLGWSCHPHTLPMPAGGHQRRELTAELAALYGAMAAAGCDDDASASGSDRVERTSYDLVGTRPSVLRSRWAVEGCGGRWTAETRCVRAGLDWDGEGVCTLVRFDPLTPPAPRAPAAPAPPAPTPAPPEVPSPPPAVAPVPPVAPGGIVLRVTDHAHVPLPGATVRLDSPSLGGASRTGVTGPKGEFAVRDLPPGRYAARVEHRGFAPGVRPEIDVVSGQLSTVILDLSRSGR